MTELGFKGLEYCQENGHCGCWERVGYCCQCDTDDPAFVIEADKEAT